MKVLVTGGAGFIGAHVIKKLAERGDAAVAVDNFNSYYSPELKEDRLKKLLHGIEFSLHRGDICDVPFMENVFEKERPDKVVHLAAMAGVRNSLKNPVLYEEVNIIGTTRLLELAVKHKVKNFVYASSSSVYGNNKKVPFAETDSVDTPISPYAASKKASELVAHVFSHIYRLKTTGLRYFTVYGPWGRPDMALFKFTENIMAGRPIDVYNYGKMTRNFTYVDDIVSGTLVALDADLDCEIMNIGGDTEERLTRFIEVIEISLGMKAKQNLLPIQPGDVPSTVADISKLRRLGWEPVTGIDVGVKKFVEWYKEYYGKIKTD